jgi:hypothetical protein
MFHQLAESSSSRPRWPRLATIFLRISKNAEHRGVEAGNVHLVLLLFAALVVVLALTKRGLLIQISGGFPATPSTLRLRGGYRQRGVEVGALELARVLPRGAPDVAVGFIVVAASVLDAER